MRVLVTVGSTRGGTEGLGEMVAEDLRAEGFEVDMRAPREARQLAGYDAVVVGGALYALRWHRDARRFVRRHAGELQGCPTWFFSSGPLDDSAAGKVIPPVKGVEELMRRVGARGHATFGGRLAPDAKGFPASAMAKKHSGDWRDPGQVKQWTHDVAAELRAAEAGRVSG
jgi:menaquinone-dependent protoporphyrinogen oxidase